MVVEYDFCIQGELELAISNLEYALSTDSFALVSLD